MRAERFDLALERLAASDWEQFEELASVFLIGDYPNLRTVASPSGDQGRDAFLYQPEQEPTVLLQYSVTQAWERKLRETAVRVTTTFPEARILIYVTNQLLGARADSLRDELRMKFNLFVDIRDRRWFTERLNTTPEREAAAERLAERVVDPYLAGRGVTSGKAQALQSDDLQTAFVYLGLQLEDDSRAKGLTKIAFEALVKAILRNTTPDRRMTRAQVLEGVRTLLPAHPPETVDIYTEGALRRMVKRSVRHWQKPDEFCLTHEEALRLADRLVDLEGADIALHNEIEALLKAHAHALELEMVDSSDHVSRVTRVVDKVLLSRGEAFATALRTGRFRLRGKDDIRRFVVADFSATPAPDSDGAAHVELVYASVRSLLTEPSEEVLRYLRSVSDTYTLFAFLRETPDVQSAVLRMFASGDLWLDTSVVLPLFAEELADAPDRMFTNIFQGAVEAGLKLYITEGVLEELEAHMRLGVTYARHAYRGERWVGNVPFLCAAFLLTGRPRTEFPSWLERFRGEVRPLDDLGIYLEEEFRVQIRNLDDDAAKTSEELRTAVRQIWQETHERRRRGRHGDDPLIALRLAEHDVENYLGVIARRSRERSGPFGFNTWWLTLDRTAYAVTRMLGIFFNIHDLMSPVLSPDFMLNYLTLGPMRRRLSRNSEISLPLVTDLRAMGLPSELLAVADAVRDELSGLDERIVRRRVRDTLDTGRLRYGVMAEQGMTGVMERLGPALVREAKQES